MKPFYVRHKNREEAIEVIDRAVANGAELDEGVVDHHHETGLIPSGWKFIGVIPCGGTFFADDGEDYGDEAEELTMEDVRMVYPLPDEQTDPRKFQNGDKVKYGHEKQWEGYVIGYSKLGTVVIQLAEEDEESWLYDSFEEEHLDLVTEESPLDTIIQILYNTQGIENQAQEILNFMEENK